MEFRGTDTPLARRFIFGEWVAFALERPFRREWLQYWPDKEREVPDATEAIGKSWFDVRIGVDQATSLKDMACRSAVVVVGQVRLPAPFLGCLFVLHGRGSWRTTSTCS